MSQTLTSLDPQWAWSPFEPTAEQPWTISLARHLYRRAGFGASLSEVERAAQLSPAEIVEPWLNSQSTAPFLKQNEQFAETLLASGNPRRLSAWWVYVMLGTPNPLLEKMTLFWHGHFATSAEKVENARAMYEQNQRLREYALGDFAAMVHAISRDPAMLIYLDSATNRKAHPNENFARELMELFVLGEGNYSEQDVQQLARCFTGWEVRQNRFRFNRYQHDEGTKTIFGQSGTYPDEAAVDLVLQHPAGPHFIAGKLVNYFCFDEPTPSPELLQPLAEQLRSDDWNVGPTVQRMLTSNLFYSPYSVARKVRSPVEMAIGLMRLLEGSTNAVQLATDLVELGQGLFYPPNVKGWEGGRTWINSTTLLERSNLVRRLVHDEKTRFGGGDLQRYMDQVGAHASTDIVQVLTDLLLPVVPPDSVQDQLVELLDRPGERNERIADCIHAISTLPEFQLN